ncbi:serine protease [Actinomadura sp. KC216]|uniref:trypsin-like serine peptidase n=1 Tax=Actinomadura sp. KC216 TaxID=2530370 RepID=UPI0010536558|nr:serine protease [Actinomadura sp. KC216]TDB80861.1 serine protease [Actinomadura sp. KC216]
MSRRSRFLAAVIPLAVTLVLPAATASAAPVRSDDAAAQAQSRQPATLAPRPDVAGEKTATNAVLRYAPDSRTTRVTLRSPGSSYVKVHFASVRLLSGDRVTVASPSGREVHTYNGDPTVRKQPGDSPFTVHGGTGFAAMSIDGDTAVVTLHSAKKRGNAAALTRQGFGARIDSYFRGFTQAEYASANPRAFSVCGAEDRRDVTCYKTSHPTEYARSRAVARQLLNGLGHCTSWRVGDTNTMLTNQHCMESAADLRGSEFQFDYECSTCGGRDPRAGVKVSGAQLLKLSPLSALDYALFSVNNFESIQQFGTLYLETREPTAGERIYIPGHGDTLPKRLTIVEDGGGNCVIRTPSSGVNTGYMCDTSGGNSGSPVLAGSSHKVIALHHLGGCPNWGTRISLVYKEISALIDNEPGAADSRVLSG